MTLEELLHKMVQDRASIIDFHIKTLSEEPYGWQITIDETEVVNAPTLSVALEEAHRYIMSNPPKRIR